MIVCGLQVNSCQMSPVIISKEKVKRDRRRIKTLISRVCRNDIINKVKKYISKVSVGFVNATNDA